MKLLIRNAKNLKSFLINDNGKTVAIQQPNILEVGLLYQILLARIKADEQKFNIFVN